MRTALRRRRQYVERVAAMAAGTSVYPPPPTRAPSQRAPPSFLALSMGTSHASSVSARGSHASYVGAPHRCVRVPSVGSPTRRRLLFRFSRALLGSAEQDARANADAERACYDQQRRCRRHLQTYLAEQQLGADESEHPRDRRAKVLKILHPLRDQSVQLPQPQDGKCIRGEGDERIGGDAEHGGHRIDGEEDVGKLYADERQKQRCCERRAVSALQEEAVSRVLVGGRQILARELHDSILGEVLVLVAFCDDGVCRVEQQQPARHERNLEALHHGDAC
mmetsp:Transcript_20394/g.47085  ORF Transcript_20394/g.47085 Transcript_20394/m.47085 type:complete len:279 (-) Transcript_20394:673-1509(-)